MATDFLSIKQACASAFAVTCAGIDSGSRKPEIATARRAAIYLARHVHLARGQLTPYRVLTKHFGLRDVSSARFAVQAVQAEIDQGSQRGVLVRSLARRLGVQLARPHPSGERRPFDAAEQAAIDAALRAGRITRITDWLPTDRLYRRASWGFCPGA